MNNEISFLVGRLMFTKKMIFRILKPFKNSISSDPERNIEREGRERVRE